MISNTNTAHWAMHIAVLQAIAAELYADHVDGMPPEKVKSLNDRIAAKSKAAATEMAAFLAKQPVAAANLFAREILEVADRVTAETLADMAPKPALGPADATR